MLKTSEISRYSTPRTHRTYTAQFKAERVAACGQPGVSIAALAGQHAMNANVLHRWLKEHQRSGRHQLAAHSPASAAAPETASSIAAFIALQLPAPAPQPETREIKVELRRGALSMVVTWPVSAAAELASWTGAVLK